MEQSRRKDFATPLEKKRAKSVKEKQNKPSQKVIPNHSTHKKEAVGHRKTNEKRQKNSNESSLPSPTEITYAYQVLSDIMHAYQKGNEYQHLHLGDRKRHMSSKRSKKSTKIWNSEEIQTNQNETSVTSIAPRTYLSNGETHYLQNVLYTMNRHIHKVDQEIWEIDQLRQGEKQANREVRKLRKQLLECTIENRTMEQNECVQLEKQLKEQEDGFEKERMAINFLLGVNKMFEVTPNSGD